MKKLVSFLILAIFVALLPEYAKAGETGSVMNILGNSAYKNKDYKSAFRDYKQSCNLGYKNGCNNLGYLYDQGQGVTSSR